MSSPEPEFHPVYKALIQRPTLWGVDQRFVFVGPIALIVITIVGLIVRLPLGAFLFGLVVMVGWHIAGQWIYQHEPQILPMLGKAVWQKGRYDPLKHEPVSIEVRKTW